MRNGAPVLVGAGRYIQGKDEIKNLGREIKYFGDKVLMVVDSTPWEKYKTQILDILANDNISVEVHDFSGYCSDQNTKTIAEKAKACGAQLIVGFGGGKCMDTSKWSAEQANIPCLTVPTSAATCAAYVYQCVMYDDTGTSLYSNFTTREVAGTIVDTQIIADAPSRLLASGIADALAKLPEMTFSMRHATKDWEQSVLPKIGLYISQFTSDTFYAQGLQALHDVKAHKVTSDVEDIVNTTIQLTGLISCFASGGKQLSVAHSMYDCVTQYFKPQRAKYLHGEIVSSALAVQYGVNGLDEATIEKQVNFLKQLGAPTKLTDIEIEPTEKNINLILDYIISHLNIEEENIRQNLRDNFKRICC